MVKISIVAAAASTAGAALAILSPTVLIDNNSVQQAISNSHVPNYQFPPTDIKPTLMRFLGNSLLIWKTLLGS